MYKLIEELVNNNIINGEEIAFNEVKVSNNEVMIYGNRMGLILLADELLKIALEDKPNAHIHLDESNFFDKNTHELIISKNEK